MKEEIEIVGAGPSGLVAAIAKIARVSGANARRNYDDRIALKVTKTLAE